MYQSTRTNSTATALRLKPKSEIKVEEFYSTFLDMLKNVLDGNMEAGNYEDSLREMFGIHAYIAFTLDRVRFSQSFLDDFVRRIECFAFWLNPR